MPYLWIFLGCYAVAFIIISMKMAAQQANMEARIKEIGGSPEELRSNFRTMMPWPKEIFIRLWAPFVFSVLPTGLFSLGYFVFS